MQRALRTTERKPVKTRDILSPSLQLCGREMLLNLTVLIASFAPRPR